MSISTCSRTVLAVLLLAVAGCEKQSGPELRVRESWKQYQAAVAKGDGRAAQQLVTSSTIDYFQRVRDLALDGTPDQLAASPLVTRYQVARFRVELGREKLEGLDGAGLYRMTIERPEWTDRATVAALSITSVSAAKSGDAVATLTAGDTTVEYEFKVEEGVPRLRVDAQIDRLDSLYAGLDPAAQEARVRELLSRTIGREIGPEVWQPLRPKAGPG